ncbi:hypothetical protein MSSIH_0526 [Methanosarcina siciliae HI350]|uniref:Uncharacterized protein n=1 Tax=Methanosarcina siciliae HI350 TaxID=1434119 RepID=A0A0E3LA12_9EURY|nr:hypothetical protein [Methanosarcina siciliae]AKB31216.1 hypothetical protein MSSIH_0526 [Methanosarcina siciliae HI350]
MFWSKDYIVERLSKIPRTLEDISIEIFEGVPPASDLVYKADLSKEHCTEASSGCRNPQARISVEQVSMEKEVMYPYMDGSVLDEFSIHSTQHQFMLPYEILDYNIKKEYRIFQPDELKARFPVVYKQLMEVKQESGAEKQEIESADCYRLEDESFLQYIKTPKIIITNNYRPHASYDVSGKYVFSGGIGVVLGDPTLYHYVTAVLNSSIARTLPEIWSREKMQGNNRLNSKMIKRFPIEFPKKQITETLISTLCRYLIYLNRQKQTAKDYSIPYCQNLIDFYRRIADLLILDTYITADLDPKLLEVLAENITASGEEFEYSDDINLLIGLQAIKTNILDSADFRKCRFNNEFTNVLATLKNNGIW